MIESVKVKVTLKAGRNIWVKGDIIKTPIHPDLLLEIRQGTGNVEVLSKSPDMISKVPKKAPPLTSTSLFKTENVSSGESSNAKREEPTLKKSKPVLVRRKK